MKQPNLGRADAKPIVRCMHWPDSESLQVMTIIHMDATQPFLISQDSRTKKTKIKFSVKF